VIRRFYGAGGGFTIKSATLTDWKRGVGEFQSPFHLGKKLI
jgi:hypothetical protein